MPTNDLAALPSEVNMNDELVERLREQRPNGECVTVARLMDEAADRIEAQAAEIRSLREKLADAYVELSGKRVHASDCATSDAPALEPGRCDCHEDKETDNG